MPYVAFESLMSLSLMHLMHLCKIQPCLQSQTPIEETTDRDFEAAFKVKETIKGDI